MCVCVCARARARACVHVCECACAEQVVLNAHVNAFPRWEKKKKEEEKSFKKRRKKKSMPQWYRVSAFACQEETNVCSFYVVSSIFRKIQTTKKRVCVCWGAGVGGGGWVWMGVGGWRDILRFEIVALPGRITSYRPLVGLDLPPQGSDTNRGISRPDLPVSRVDRYKCYGGLVVA